MVTRLLSIRDTRCIECGDPHRLVTVSQERVMSRCYVCGDTAITITPAAGSGADQASPRARGQPAAA